MAEETTTSTEATDSADSQTKPVGVAGPTIYGGYRLIADIVASSAKVVVGLAWPITVLVVLHYAVVHTDLKAFQSFLSTLMEGKERMKVTVGPKEVSFEIVQQVQSGLTRQIAAQGGTVSSDQQKEVQRAAESATQRLQPASPAPDTRMKILWVDDHPQNNIGLQYAFQALGMIVVCVDSNDGVEEAFSTTGGFDVVITDMYRDAAGNAPAQPEAGWRTVQMIKAAHEKVPVIIYAGRYSAAHANDPLTPPVIADTNNTQKVFDLVLDIASKKLR